MKKVYLTIALVFTLYGGINLIRYGLNYAILSEYGKGFLVGNCIILVIGLFFAFLYFRKKKTS